MGRTLFFCLEPVDPNGSKFRFIFRKGLEHVEKYGA